MIRFTCSVRQFHVINHSYKRGRLKKCNTDGWALELLSPEIHVATPSILFQQWNQSGRDKWKRKCHWRLSHWSGTETNLSSSLSAGIRITQCRARSAWLLPLQLFDCSHNSDNWIFPNMVINFVKLMSGLFVSLMFLMFYSQKHNLILFMAAATQLCSFNVLS